jgi:hypothetical protein
MKVDELSKVKLVKCDEGYKLDVKYKKRYPLIEIIGFSILILFIIDYYYNFGIIDFISKINK